MLKELFIAFIIALVIGSIFNQMNSSSQASGGMGGDNGGQMGGGGGGGSGNLASDQNAQAGIELVSDVDEGSFQGLVLDSKEPVLVEFYTDNCPHCRTMLPVLGKLAYDGQGVLRVCKVNAGKVPALADRYDVNGVPAFALFGEGHLLDATSGARTLSEMKTWLSTNNIAVTTPGKVGS